MKKLLFVLVGMLFFGCEEENSSDITTIDNSNSSLQKIEFQELPSDIQSIALSFNSVLKERQKSGKNEEGFGSIIQSNVNKLDKDTGEVSYAFAMEKVKEGVDLDNFIISKNVNGKIIKTIIRYENDDDTKQNYHEYSGQVKVYDKDGELKISQEVVNGKIIADNVKSNNKSSKIIDDCILVDIQYAFYEDPFGELWLKDVMYTYDCVEIYGGDDGGGSGSGSGGGGSSGNSNISFTPNEEETIQCPEGFVLDVNGDCVEEDCSLTCGDNEKLDSANCECIPTNCDYKTGYIHQSAFTGNTATIGENTTSSQDNFRDDSGAVFGSVNCNSGKVDSGSTVEVTGPKESRDYVKADGTIAQSYYYPIKYLDCPKGNKPGNPDYDSTKPCSDCESGDPVPDPEIQPQTTPCGMKGGMFGTDVRGNNGVGQPCSGIDHHGVDLKNEQGEPVYAMFDGNSALFYEEDGAGYYVLITSLIGSDTIKNYYFHLVEDTRVSGTVKAGDIIGYQGNSGNLVNGIAQGTTESHVHIKIRKNGVIVDPLPYFKTTFNETTGAVTSTDCN